LWYGFRVSQEVNNLKNIAIGFLVAIVAFAFGVAVAPALAFNYAQFAAPVMLTGLALLALIGLQSWRRTNSRRTRNKDAKAETFRQKTTKDVMGSA
jgi:threonine/homoserine/homoserine lactone efflux protein